LELRNENLTSEEIEEIRKAGLKEARKAILKELLKKSREIGRSIELSTLGSKMIIEPGRICYPCSDSEGEWVKTAWDSKKSELDECIGEVVEILPIWDILQTLLTNPKIIKIKIS
jgi:hypothetical protein